MRRGEADKRVRDQAKANKLVNTDDRQEGGRGGIKKCCHHLRSGVHILSKATKARTADCKASTLSETQQCHILMELLRAPLMRTQTCKMAAKCE